MAQKTVVQTREFLRAATKAAMWADKRSPIQAIHCIRLVCKNDTLELVATDGSSSDISLYMPIDATVEFDVCIPATTLVQKAQILARVSEEMTISVGKLIVISAGKHSSRISPISTEYFPNVARDFDYDDGTGIDPQELADSVRKTITAADANSPFPALEGIYLNDGDMVSVDGTKLALISNIYLLKEATLVHATTLSKAAKVLDGVGEAGMLRTDGKLVIYWNGGVITSSIIAYDFPDYHSIMPDSYETEFIVPREEMAIAIGLAAIEAAESRNLVVMDIHEDNLLIQASSSEGSHNSEIDYISFSGPPKRIGISFKYLKDVFAKIKTDELRVGINDINGLVVFHGDENFRYGIMPMHIVG